jgi:hypothetical protein
MRNDDCQAILRDCPRALPAKLEFEVVDNYFSVFYNIKNTGGGAYG